MFRVQFTRLSLRRYCTLGTSIAMAFDSEWLSSFPSPRTPTWIFSPNDRKHVSALKVPPGKKKRKVVCKYSIPLYCSWRLHCGALLLWRVRQPLYKGCLFSSCNHGEYSKWGKKSIPGYTNSILVLLDCTGEEK